MLNKKSQRVSLDSKYEYAFVIRAEGIHIFPVENGSDNRFLFSDADAAGEPKTVVVVRIPRIKSCFRMVMTAKTITEDFDVKYLTGEPTDD